MSYSLHFLSQLHKIRRSKKHIQVALQTNFKLESIIPAYKKLGENIGQLKPRELTLRIDSADLYSHHFFESLAQHLSRQTLDCLTLEFQVQSNPELISRLEKIHNIALRDRFSPLSKLIQCLSPNQLRQLSALEEDQEKVSFVRRFHISSLAQIFKNLSDLTQQRIRTKKLVINGPVEVFVEAINADLFEVIETLCLNSNLNAWPKVHDSTEQCDQQVFSTLKGHFPHITRLEIKADVPLQTIREVIGIEDYPNLEQLILH